MRQPEYSGQFKRDVKQAQQRGKDMEKLRALLSLLIEESPSLTEERKAEPKALSEQPDTTIDYSD